jgi:hypothetical protein
MPVSLVSSLRCRAILSAHGGGGSLDSSDESNDGPDAAAAALEGSSFFGTAASAIAMKANENSCDPDPDALTRDTALGQSTASCPLLLHFMHNTPRFSDPIDDLCELRLLLSDRLRSFLSPLP